LRHLPTRFAFQSYILNRHGPEPSTYLLLMRIVKSQYRMHRQ